MKLRLEIPLRTNVLSAVARRSIPQGRGQDRTPEIKEGSHIGVSAMPEPDGTQKAVAVHIFPENQRGAAEEAARVNVGRDGITPPM